MRYTLGVTFLVAAMCAASASAQVPLTVRVARGDPAAGTSAAFGSVYASRINASGDLVFLGYIPRSPEALDSSIGGYWAERDGTRRLVALAGNAAPSAGGPTFDFNRIYSPSVPSRFAPHAMNNAGQVLFGAWLDKLLFPSETSPDPRVDASNDGGIWLDDVLVAREGGAVPDVPGATFLEVVRDYNWPLVLNNRGTVGFLATMGGSFPNPNPFGDTTGIWKGVPGDLHLVARAGIATPLWPANPLSRVDSVQIDDSDRMVFSARIGCPSTGCSAGEPGSIDQNETILQERGGEITAVVVEGMPAPGTPPGTVFGILPGARSTTFWLLDVNSAGGTAFFARLRGAATSENDSSAWLATEAGTALVAREGDYVPGSTTRVYGDFFEDGTMRSLLLNSAGEVAFVASTRPAGGGAAAWNDVIVAGRPGALRRVVAAGDAAPGCGTGCSFVRFEHLAFNGRGQATFWAEVSGGTTTDLSWYGYWAHDPNVGLLSVVRGTDPIEVPIAGVTHSGTVVNPSPGTEAGGSFQYDRPTTLNDSGQFVLPIAIGGLGAPWYYVSTLVVAQLPTDTTPPVTTASLAGELGNGDWYRSAVQVTLGATDSESGVASTSYSLDSATWSTYAGAFTVANDGVTSVAFASIDRAGNKETPRAIEVRIDTTPPVVSYSGNRGTYTTGETVNITCEATDGGSGLASTTCESIVGEAGSFNIGENTFTAMASDGAGNVGIGTTSFIVTFASPYAEIRYWLPRWVTSPEVAASLLDKIDAAEQAALRGNTQAKARILDSFVNQVAAQAGKTVTKENAATLTAMALAL